ncbi:unnamed protein product [Brugia pahangi]|uniref:Secreted protein n=1 Tax=Brugia pahangi TaxID=6280 RepID=A0A0N4TPP1_BRUPA|nr:unnamed protein product [Brugia pahangi]
MNSYSSSIRYRTLIPFLTTLSSFYQFIVRSAKPVLQLIIVWLGLGDCVTSLPSKVKRWMSLLCTVRIRYLRKVNSRKSVLISVIGPGRDWWWTLFLQDNDEY